MTIKERPPSDEFSHEANSFRPKKKLRLPIGSSAPIPSGERLVGIAIKEDPAATAVSTPEKRQNGGSPLNKTQLPHIELEPAHAPTPLPPLKTEPISKQLVSNRGAIGKQLVSDKGAISEQLVSNKTVISKQLVSNKGAIGKQLVSNTPTVDNQPNCSELLPSAPLERHSDVHQKIRTRQTGDTRLSAELTTQWPNPLPSNSQVQDCSVQDTSETDRVHSDNELISKQLVSNKTAISKQLVSNKTAISKQLVSNSPNQGESIGKQLVSDQEAISKQLVSERSANKTAIGKQLVSIAITLQQLSPLQQKLLFYLFEEAKKTRSRITDPVSSTSLADALNTTKQTLKDLIAKLKKREVFTSTHAKRGAGGWTIFELSDSIYNELLDAEKRGKLTPIGKQLVSNWGVNWIAKPSSSSSEYLNNQKTTTSPNSESEKQPLPQEWSDIDFSSLASIGFKEIHLRQIFEAGKATPEMVQESIYELDHDLRSGGKHGLRSPLLVLLKLLRGKGEPYTAVTPGYVSDDLKYERKKLEELKRRQHELDAIRYEQREVLNRDAHQAEESEFEAWLKTKSESQLKSFANTFKPESPAGQAMIRDAFRKEKEQICGEIEQHI